MLLYISGSFPENQEGIASGAKVLLDSMIKIVGSDEIILLTTDVPIISNSINKNTTVRYVQITNWRVSFRNINKILSILNNYPITAIHMEYPGDLYGKTFLASFLPFIVKIYNLLKNSKISFNVRLHEFSRARLLRKLAIFPIVFFSDRLYIPSQKDREILKKIARKKIVKTLIGSNIQVFHHNIQKKVFFTISYFGSVYPGKGIEKMLLIWKKVKELDKNNIIRFKIIGDIGIESDNHFRDYHKKVWQLIDKFNLRNSILVTGFISDENVSKEISDSDVATLFYEDGLTLRRGSFLAYLSHGIPIVTSKGDDDANYFFSDCSGVFMTETEQSAINAIYSVVDSSVNDKEQMRHTNISLSKNFDWNEIALGFLKDYKIVSEKKLL